MIESNMKIELAAEFMMSNHPTNSVPIPGAAAGAVLIIACIVGSVIIDLVIGLIRYFNFIKG